MTDSNDTPFTEQEIDMLAALRDLRPDDGQLDTPPVGVWAAIDSAVTATAGTRDPQPASPSSRRRWWVAAAASVAALAVGISAIALFGGDSEVVIAATALTSDGLDGAPAGLLGQAEVIESRGGEVIRVDIGEARAGSGEYLEVWLIKPDVSGMVSLGTVRPDGRYEFPSGLSLADYPIVDVSTEPYDGDPKHSGASLLRGQLEL